MCDPCQIEARIVSVDDEVKAYFKTTFERLHAERVQMEVQVNRMEKLVERMEAANGK
ncbi:MAG: hypothetical protein V4587_06875 [Acidobacteriota bacterium]